jgi:hypothetical protein
MPLAIPVTVDPETEQMLGVMLVKVTGFPEPPPVALMFSVPPTGIGDVAPIVID